MIKTVELENGNKLHYKTHPRYGTWSVNFDKGGIPPILEGQFRSLQDLEKKVNYYLANREKNKTKVKSDA